MTLLSDGTPRYIVQAASTQTVAGWSYWKQKTRQDKKFAVRENELLMSLRNLEDQMTIADAASYNSYAGAYTVNGADTYADIFSVG